MTFTTLRGDGRGDGRWGEMKPKTDDNDDGDEVGRLVIEASLVIGDWWSGIGDGDDDSGCLDGDRSLDYDMDSWRCHIRIWKGVGEVYRKIGNCEININELNCTAGWNLTKILDEKSRVSIC